MVCRRPAVAVRRPHRSATGGLLLGSYLIVSPEDDQDGVHRCTIAAGGGGGIRRGGVQALHPCPLLR